MFKILIISFGILFFWTTTGTAANPLCDSLPSLKTNLIKGADNKGGAEFLERNKKLLAMKTIWVEDDGQDAICTRYVVIKIYKIEDALNGRVRVRYDWGRSALWELGPGGYYTNGKIIDGRVKLRLRTGEAIFTTTGAEHHGDGITQGVVTVLEPLGS